MTPLTWVPVSQMMVKGCKRPVCNLQIEGYIKTNESLFSQSICHRQAHNCAKTLEKLACNPGPFLSLKVFRNLMHLTIGSSGL